MKPPILSASKKKSKKSSLILTLSGAGLLIGVGSAAYWFFSQGQLFYRDLLTGANIIPSDALFAVSLTTDTKQWQKLQEFGTKETQAQLNQSLVQLRDRFLTNNGYNFEKDIQPWVGDEVTLAILAPQINKSAPKPVSTIENPASNSQSMVMVLPVKNAEKAKTIFAQPQTLKQGKWIERTYQGITIKQSQGQSGENLSAAFLDGKFLVITDNPQTTERTINAYKSRTSLATVGGFADNFPKIASYQPLAQFYINVPNAAKIGSTTPNRRLPAQVLAQLQNNQGLAGTVILESQGLRIKGVSWLNPNSQRVLVVENKAGTMQNRVPAETLMMLSGVNLQRLWSEYVLTSQGNPLSPITPEQMRSGVKSLTSMDLEQDFLSWMKGEVAVAVIPGTPKPGSSQDFRAAFVLMIQASDANGGQSLRQLAETSIKQLDEVMKTQYQFQIKSTTVAGKPVVNWISPFGTLTATHGWLDGDVAFLAIGSPITDKILPKPSTSLANSLAFQQTVPTEPNPTNGQFYMDVEQITKNFPLPRLIPQQQTLLAATRSIGMTSAISDNRSTRYDIFLTLKKVDK
ncbi:DUF3352 domain-containing protein [Anabaena minutissima FACHB-250]|nr:DUF3352 domain-containing protein [Anabaena minutissima FACHB-250]